MSGSVHKLKEYAVALEVFDRSPDYNPKTDAIVRVEARRLRSRLEEYYANAGAGAPIRISFPSGSYVPLIEVREAPQTGGAAPGSDGMAAFSRGLSAAAVALVAILLLQAVIPRKQGVAGEVVRLVRDSAAAVDPAVSRDGKQLAYSSDQAGNLDIWLRDLDSSEAQRLTTDPAADSAPDLAPDSPEIVFRSERNGGGVYLISTKGGQERLIAPFGRSPKFSPDGKQIAYWMGQEHHFEGKVFVASSTGGEPKRVAADLAAAEWPAWASDGKHLLVLGSRGPAGGLTPDRGDLFLVPVDGGPSEETGWIDAVRRMGLSPQGPVTWNGSQVLFSARMGRLNDFSAITQGAANLWSIHLSQEKGTTSGEPQRITFGAAFEGAPHALPGGDLIFSGANYHVSVFQSLLDRSGRAAGPPQPVFSAPGSYILPDLSRDSSRLVAVSDRSGRVDLWVKDFRTGEEWAATSTEAFERAPVVSDDGTIFFGLREGRQYRMYRTRERGGEAAEVCPDCGSIADVSPNGAYVIFHTGEPWSAYVLDVRTGEKRLLLGNAGRTYSSRISPDGKWIAFHIDTGGDEMPRRVMVAPFSPGRRIPESEWIPVSDAGESAFDPCWSPNGSLLFFFSSRDGNRCIWARRLKAGSKQPEGQTFAVAHLHTMSPHIRDSLGMRLTAGNGRIIFSAIDLSSTIYRLRLGR